MILNDSFIKAVQKNLWAEYGEQFIYSMTQWWHTCGTIQCLTFLISLLLCAHKGSNDAAQTGTRYPGVH